MKDWKTLTIGVSQTIAPMRTQLLRLKGSPQPGGSDDIAIGNLYSDLGKHEAAIERILAKYESGELRINVIGAEEPAFRSLTHNLSRHAGQIDILGSEPSLADIHDYRDYLRSFLSAGPHGPGKPPPGDEEDVPEEGKSDI